MILGLDKKSIDALLAEPRQLKLTRKSVRATEYKPMDPKEVARLRKKYGDDPFFGTNFPVSPVMLALFDCLTYSQFDKEPTYEWFEKTPRESTRREQLRRKLPHFLFRWNPPQVEYLASCHMNLTKKSARPFRYLIKGRWRCFKTMQRIREDGTRP